MVQFSAETLEGDGGAKSHEGNNKSELDEVLSFLLQNKSQSCSLQRNREIPGRIRVSVFDVRNLSILSPGRDRLHLVRCAYLSHGGTRVLS